MDYLSSSLVFSLLSIVWFFLVLAILTAHLAIARSSTLIVLGFVCMCLNVTYYFSFYVQIYIIHILEYILLLGLGSLYLFVCAHTIRFAIRFHFSTVFFILDSNSMQVSFIHTYHGNSTWKYVKINTIESTTNSLKRIRTSLYIRGIVFATICIAGSKAFWPNQNHFVWCSSWKQSSTWILPSSC